MAETYTYGGKAGRASKRDSEIIFNGTGGITFTQGLTYTDLGEIASLNYPRCNFTRCTTDGDAGAARNVSFTRSRGVLTAVPGYASTIQYHPNGLLYRIYHTGAPRLVQEADANGRARPSKIFVKRESTTLWSTGSYSYDGASNIKSIGDSSFVYDEVSRLSSAKVSLDQEGSGSLVEQDYTYDAFGNLKEITGSPGLAIPTDSSTNRLSGSVNYDNAGNLQSWNGNLYEYDPLHMMTRLTTPGGEDWLYVYTADDERIWMHGLADATNRYTLRSFSGKVLREYTVVNDNWTRERDYIYGNGRLLAAETSDGLRHFYADHLGTTRLITDEEGDQVAYHVYYPFGEEATGPSQDEERMKFTGHERDLGDPSGTGDDLDYMHARFCSPITGRFLSVDPAMQISRAKKMPQLWNRYAYSIGNPLKYVDPTGKTLELPGTEKEQEKALADLRNTVPVHLRRFVKTRTTKDGRVIIDDRFLNARSSSSSGNFQALRQIANSPGTALFNSSQTTVTSTSGSEIIGASRAASGSGITFSAKQSTSGQIEAYTGGDLIASKTAETTAHELRHVRRYLLGLPAIDEFIGTSHVENGMLSINIRLDPNGPVNVETLAAEREAISYYDPFVPLLH